MEATIPTRTHEAVAVAPPEPAVATAGATPMEPAPPTTPARSRGVRRLVVFVGKKKRR
jgi:hypothetical protein